jgi:hypothetical protein
MKFFCAVVFAAGVALLSPATLPALAKTLVVDKAAAPLDEYFGAQKMSAIGIRMRIDSLGRQYHAHMLSDGDLMHDATIAEASLRAWNVRYPRDPWLAPTAFHLAQLYAQVQSPAGRASATSMLHFTADTFGKTRFGHLSRLRLAQGFPPLRPDSGASPAAGSAASPGPSTPAMSASPDAGASPSDTSPVAPSVAPSPGRSAPA